ncbi:MAG: small ribosomal subunit Rsm22 family protein [Opitutus sp.]
MTWNELDWPALDRLRDRFLRGSPGDGPYWESVGDLGSYDLTYGERIGWKWDHVLRELRLRGWAPRTRSVLDWGCGSGIASRRVIRLFGMQNFESLLLWDHSPLATDFAEDSARMAFPEIAVAQATPGLLAGIESIGLLVLSHVLNELSEADLAALRTFAARAEAILWVEAGTHTVSRQLGGVREQLRASEFRVLAPCTHGNECPMFAAGNERHWCHFFAPPPGEIFADSNWVKFGQRAGIDLRSLPYSFLALDRSTLPAVAPVSDPSEVLAGPNDPDLSRIIGRPEHFKPFARFLNCDATGLTELELPKRAAPALYKQLDRTKAPLIYRWQREGGIILNGEPLDSPRAP